MRDIRDELKERLTEATARRQNHIALAREAEAEEASVRNLLEIEDRRFGSHKKSLQDLLFEAKQKQAESSLTEFVRSVLDDGQPHSLNNLTGIANVKGISVQEGKSLKRVLNATLLGLMNKKQIEQNGEGKWVLKKQEAPSAATDEASP